ncbi:hypothetical protein EV424DRAFT_1351258 [Suillus variegatus]|nr:hypothetical protein EV424DRAFT_1351258 [Suillus variegatus]
MAPGTGRLDAYFPSVQDHQQCSTRKLPPEFSQDRPGCFSAGISNAVTPSAGISNTVCPSAGVTSDRPVIPGATTEDCPVLGSTGINNSMAIAAGQTRSQHLFSISMGIDPRSFTFQNLDEFYLFMEMRAEFKWLSYQMTSKRWVLATEEYNRHLIKKKGHKITKNDYTSRKNSESFWRRHCSVVPLVKEEPGRKARKAQTCSRCQTIMYPGPENSPLNHKKGYCADGVKQSSKAAGEELPPWPQTEAFSKLLISRTEVHKSDNMVLFRLFKGFVTDPTTPHDRIVSRNGEEWLRINYLQQ